METYVGRDGTVPQRPVLGSDAPSSLVNGNFAQGFTGWTVEGNLFNRYVNPTTQTLRVSSFAANGAVDRGAISQSFHVHATATTLTFSIMGGDASAKLVVDGEVVRESWGSIDAKDSSRNVQRAVQWNLQEFRGRTATIMVDDQRQDQWGFVDVADFVLNSDP